MENGEWIIWIIVASGLLLVGGLGMHNWFMGPVLMILSVLVFVYIIYTLVRSGRDEREDPLDALKRRYANGEISKDRYEKMKKDIEK